MPTIRRAEPRDTDELVGLRLAFLREWGNVRSDDEVAALAPAIRRFVVETMLTGRLAAWLAEEDGRAVGTAWLSLRDRPPLVGNLAGVEAYLVNVYTLPEHRRKGIASALLEQAVGFARQTNARCIRLHAVETIAPLYARLGFARTGDEMTLAW
jgi:GNAT superfamily N-acetyltransferase